MTQKVRIEATADEELALDSVGDLSAITPASELEDDSEPQTASKPERHRLDADDDETEPTMADPKWSDFVMKHFEDDELDENGRPYIHGLRRVVRLLLGPIKASIARVVQAPSFLPGDRFPQLQVATVEHTIQLLMLRVEHENLKPYEMTFTETSDVYFGNADPMVARHPSATASTRAEGRALRKALGLDRIITAEEATKVPLEDSGVDGTISETQVKFIDNLCRKNNVNVMKFVTMGKVKYSQITDVPFGVALKMVEHLSGLQNDQSRITDDIRGYDPKWRK